MRFDDLVPALCFHHAVVVERKKKGSGRFHRHLIAVSPTLVAEWLATDGDDVRGSLLPTRQVVGVVAGEDFDVLGVSGFAPERVDSALETLGPAARWHQDRDHRTISR